MLVGETWKPSLASLGLTRLCVAAHRRGNSTNLTQDVVCGPGFTTDDSRDVPQSLKDKVKTEYGMKLEKSGKTLEIDHIISLELGGSNDIANLYPEKRDVAPGYIVKDALENRLHDVVCTDHTMTLRQVQKAIAKNWETLFKKVYGVAPKWGVSRGATRTRRGADTPRPRNATTSARRALDGR